MSVVRRRPRPLNPYSFVRYREIGFSIPPPPPLLSWIERNTLRRLDSGTYVTLDRPATLVRSTISIAFSHDGKFFASTHGDHSVKVFNYPSGVQIACLDGHPRTPWTVRFHPFDSNILASGCLGHDCRVWDISKKQCIRKHNFRASISCVSFSPDGTLLAVTSGRFLLLWNYLQPTPDGNRHTSTEYDGHRGPGLPQELLEGANPFHMVDFHPSGTMLMTGEKNRYSTTPPGAAPPLQQEEQFTLKLVIHRFDPHAHNTFTNPVLIVPRAVAYNDAGIHFSPCGTMLAACIPVPVEQTFAFHIAVLSLIPRPRLPVGTVLYQSPLDKGHVSALTNLKFSATSKHILAGFSFRPANPVLRGHAEHYDATAGRGGTSSGQPPQVRVVNIYEVNNKFEMIRSLCADMDVTEGHRGGAEDEINVAVFAPVVGVADGVVYGTQKGRIRMFQQATGSFAKVFPTCQGYADSRAEWTGEVPNPWADDPMPPLPPTRASSTTQPPGGSTHDVPARHNSV